MDLRETEKTWEIKKIKMQQNEFILKENEEKLKKILKINQ